MKHSIKEVVAVFDDERSLDHAVSALKRYGFGSEVFTVLGREEAIEKKLGHRYQRVKDLEDLPNIPRDVFFSRYVRLTGDFLPVPILASIGALSFAFVNPVPTIVVAAGVGAAIGAALGYVSHDTFVRHLEEQIQKGGLLLWVFVQNAKEEKLALEGLRAHSGHDVHSHEFSA